jgi:tyrosyl-tRNA synthetase
VSPSLWEAVRARAVEIHVADHLKERLERGEKIRVKFGMDPTAPDLHVGHLVVLDVLRLFQEAGHTPVIIVGDYTARIGDPSGRSETRPMLTKEQVEQNARTYFEQVFKVLDRERTEIHGNAEWLGEMTAADVLGLLGKATLQQVLQREDFAERMKDGSAIGAHEILYPFSQGYDSVAVRSDLEVGGTDQLFNLLFAREIQRAYGQPPQDVAVFPLLEGLDGSIKMSKSMNNYIGVTEAPEQVYGKAMSIPDHLIERYLRLVSGVAPQEAEAALALGPRDAKAALARRLVLRLHGEDAALRAEEDFDVKFRRRDLAQAEMPEVELPAGGSAADAVMRAGFAPSFSQVKKVADQGGLAVNGEKVAAAAAVAEGDVVKFGKRNFVRVRVR